MDLDIATNANKTASNRAIADPLPAPISEERYSPPSTEVNPKTCVQIIHERKLLPIICAVAAGVTSNDVSNNSPTSCTILTTTAAVITLNNNPIFRTGIPWTAADKGSTVVASKPFLIKNRMRIEDEQIIEITQIPFLQILTQDDTLFMHANKIGINCISTPFDETAVDLLEELNNPVYKVASSECVDLLLIKKITKLLVKNY